MQSAVVNALMRASARSAALKSSTAITSRAAPLSRGSFLITPSYKARFAVRGYAAATATRSRTTAAKTAAKKTPAKKAAPKKTATKKAAAKKPAAKKPVSKKKKTTPKKKAAPKKVKKVKTDEEKLADQKKALKRTALLNKEPKQLPSTAWAVYNAQQLSSVGGASLPERVKTVAAQYKTISESEKQRLQEQADRNKAANEVNYKKWVETIPPAEVMLANNARTLIRRKFPDVRVGRHSIVDERLPKRAPNGFALFVSEYMANNPDARSNPTSHMSALSVQWRGLSEDQKKPFLDRSAVLASAYNKQMEAIRA